MQPNSLLTRVDSPEMVGKAAVIIRVSPMGTFAGWSNGHGMPCPYNEITLRARSRDLGDATLD